MRSIAPENRDLAMAAGQNHVHRSGLNQSQIQTQDLLFTCQRQPSSNSIQNTDKDVYGNDDANANANANANDDDEEEEEEFRVNVSPDIPLPLQIYFPTPVASDDSSMKFNFPGNLSDQQAGFSRSTRSQQFNSVDRDLAKKNGNPEHFKNSDRNKTRYSVGDVEGNYDTPRRYVPRPSNPSPMPKVPKLNLPLK